MRTMYWKHRNINAPKFVVDDGVEHLTLDDLFHADTCFLCSGAGCDECGGAGDLCEDDDDEIARWRVWRLRVGASTKVGGGAQAQFTVKRVR